ncbi:transposase [Lysobacter tyrosinilyticus]
MCRNTSFSAATIASHFFTDGDYLRYRTDLRELALREGCAIHAYALMTNHVHLLMTPMAAGAVARLMQSLGRRYVRYVNDSYHRTGTLWEGRYKSCLVDDGNYLLQCHRYIELNPLRAAMVADPCDYPWSSHRRNARGDYDPLISPHPSYLGLSPDTDQRQRIYRALVMETVDPTEIQAIREHLQRQHAYGTHRFRVAIETQLGRSAGPQKIGRPRKSKAI